MWGRPQPDQLQLRILVNNTLLTVEGDSVMTLGHTYQGYRIKVAVLCCRRRCCAAAAGAVLPPPVLCCRRR